MSKLRENYNNACNAYLKAFCDKHGFDYNDAKESWIAGYVGDVCLCGDFYISLEDMITDIENDAPEDEYIKYYDYTMECHEYGISCPNYISWLKGCPRLSEEQRKSLREAKNRVYKAKKEFERILKEENDKIAGGF